MQEIFGRLKTLEAENRARSFHPLSIGSLSTSDNMLRLSELTTMTFEKKPQVFTLRLCTMDVSGALCISFRIVQPISP
ncbi:UNVERIFIED_CONTAM: hypothetical protein Sangu_1181200 [Sesamum angustifolium]|uniref:Uncharacterized protein n=1 Tax=Sesamum angustifolium TaxID=2727405 RepID=A0AAW2NIW4_9LAMI